MSRTAIVFVCVALGVSSVAWAQVTTGTISGTVADESGGVLPGVEISLTNLDTGVGRAVVSDDEGRYRAPNLTLGNYEVEAALAGFQTGVRTGITLSVGSEAVVNITLGIGEISERVVVEGEAPLVESTSATVTGLVENQKIRDLPLNGRSFTQLIALQEGVGTPLGMASGQPGNEGAKISIAGTRITETAFLLDGTDIRGNFNTTPGSVAGVLLGVDTVREVSVVTSVASAEYGGFTGGVVNAVTRSGTNQFHGSLFEFHRNSALDARNFFDREPENPLERSKPPNFIRNQFGGVISGPIVRDKTFFIGSYEGLRDRLTTTATSNVLDEDAHNGILPPAAGGNIGILPSVQPYVDLYPLPNAVNFGDGTAQWIHPRPIATNEDYFMAKIDHNFSDSNSLFVRYTFDDSQKTNLSGLENFEEIRDTRSQYVTIENKMILSPTLVNEVRVAFNRFRADSASEPLGVDPSLKFIDSGDRDFGDFSVSGISSWGPSALTRLKQTLNRFEYADNLVYSTGRHSIKVGAKVTRIQFNLINCLFCPGRYTFRSIPSFFQAQPLLSLVTLGEIDPPGELQEPPFVRGRVGPVVKQGYRQTTFGFYVQDDYKWNPNLTLNLGFRYEFYTAPSEVNDKTSNLDEPLQSAVRVGNPILARNPSFNSYGPRIGLAWDPTGEGKTSIRTGFGIFYDFFGPTKFLGAQTSAPFFNRVLPFGPNATFPNVADGITDEVIQSGSGVYVFKTPNQSYVMQWNMTVQQEIISQTVVTVGYQGSRGVKLSRMSDVNQAPVEVQNGRYFWPEDGVRQNPNFQMIRMFSFDVNSFYHSARVGVKRRFGQGFQFQSSYTFSKSTDEASNSGPFDGIGTPNGTGNVFFDQKVDKSLSSFNVRHNYSFNTTVELPFGAGKAFGSGAGGVAQKLIGGWQLSSILTLATGSPAPIRVSFNRSRSRANPDLTERPDLVVGADTNPVLSDGRDPNRYFDVGSFVLQPEGFWGTVGRNTLIRPGIATIDLSLLKDTAISEQTTLQFRAEFFNIANRANFGSPSTTVFRSPDGVPSSSAGVITSTISTSRQIQFALKLLF